MISDFPNHPVRWHVHIIFAIRWKYLLKTILVYSPLQVGGTAGFADYGMTAIPARIAIIVQSPTRHILSLRSERMKLTFPIFWEIISYIVLVPHTRS
jgi:hypothetical protein